MWARRLHLFELEDLAWVPAVIRRGITDLLQHQLARYRVYDPLLPVVARLLALPAGPCAHMVDLCSGSSGPVLRLRSLLREQGIAPPRVTLTDKFPNLTALQAASCAAGDGVVYSSEPVDAADVPARLDGVRTLFTAFHHFRPEMARRILADAADKGAAIGVFEFTGRSAANVAKAVLLAPLLVLADTASIRPVAPWRLFLTYLLPVMPLAYAWDALVSHLRTYSVAELHELVRPLQRPGYEWEIGEVPSPAGGFMLTYLIGRPAPA
jgi:hypothetical protein